MAKTRPFNNETAVSLALAQAAANAEKPTEQPKATEQKADAPTD